jgi:ubiquitin-protein ligase
MSTKLSSTKISNMSRNKRILHELLEISKNNYEGIYIGECNEQFDKWEVLIMGPSDTPYEWGYFFFLLEFPEQYPHKSPRVTFKTTTSNIRFNPNLYSNGKVCLSILGTWHGPIETKWNSGRTAIEVLLQIQTHIFIPDPFYNEPGMGSRPITDSIKYNLIIEFHKFDYAIYYMLKNPIFPQFYEIMKEHYELNKTDIFSKLYFLNNNIDKMYNEYGILFNNAPCINVQYVTQTHNIHIVYSRILNKLENLNLNEKAKPNENEKAKPNENEKAKPNENEKAKPNEN